MTARSIRTNASMRPVSEPVLYSESRISEKWIRRFHLSLLPVQKRGPTNLEQPSTDYYEHIGFPLESGILRTSSSKFATPRFNIEQYSRNVGAWRRVISSVYENYIILNDIMVLGWVLTQVFVNLPTYVPKDSRMWCWLPRFIIPLKSITFQN